MISSDDRAQGLGGFTSHRRTLRLIADSRFQSHNFPRGSNYLLRKGGGAIKAAFPILQRPQQRTIETGIGVFPNCFGSLEYLDRASSIQVGDNLPVLFTDLA